MAVHDPTDTGLLLATVQVHLGYNLLLRNLWQQRRRWVTELTEREDGTVVVTHDGGVERRLTLQQSDGPSMADLAEKAKTWFWVDREAGEVLDSEALDALLKSDLSIAKENLVVTPVMGETVEQSRQIVEPFAKLTKEQLSKIADQDDGGSPKKQLQQLERISQLSGLGFMAMGLLAYVFGNRSAESYIRTVAQNYKPPDPSRPPPAPMGRTSRSAQKAREAELGGHGTSQSPGLAPLAPLASVAAAAAATAAAGRRQQRQRVACRAERQSAAARKAVTEKLVTSIDPSAGPEGTYQVGIDFKNWLQSAKEELKVDNLKVEGKVPAWLRGHL
ncbi:unnamed protein product, partial [Effrenium voratum]